MKQSFPRFWIFRHIVSLFAAVGILILTQAGFADPGGIPNENASENAKGKAKGKGKGKGGDGDDANDVDPTPIAHAIAADAGGNAAQYSRYAENLARTLSRLTPAQRAKVLGGD